MRRLAIGLSVLVYVGLANLGFAQSNDPLTGEWFVTRMIFGTTQYQRFTAKLEDGKVTGAFANGRKIDGTFDGKVLHFTAKNDDSTIECTATVKGDTMSGKFVETPSDDPKDVWDNPITATRASTNSAAPQR